MNTQQQIFAVALLTCLLVSSTTLASRMPPADVEPVEHSGVRYEAEHWATDHDYEQNGGVVEAYSLESDELLWSLLVYEIIYDPNLESDVQDIFITDLTIEDGDLRVENEAGGVYLVDLDNRSVETIEGKRVYGDETNGAGCSMIPRRVQASSLVALILEILF